MRDIKTEELKRIIEENKNGRDVLIDFYTTWCGPCKLQKKILKNYDDVLKLLFPNIELYSFNCDEGDEGFWSKFVSTGVPQLILYTNGKTIKFETGLTQIDEIIEVLEKNLKNKNEPEIATFKEFILK